MNAVMKMFKAGTGKVFEVEGRYALVAFRAVVLLMVLFFVLTQDADGLRLNLADWNALQGLLGLSLLQAASNAFLAFCPLRWLRRGLAVGLFLFDILFVSCALYWTQGFETDLFLIYFLVVFMTVIARKPTLSFGVASLSCFLYGYIFLKANAVSDLLSPSVMIRFPLLLVTAFLSSVVARVAEMEKDDMASQVQSYWNRSGRMFLLGDAASRMVYALHRPLTQLLGSLELLLSDPMKSPALRSSREDAASQDDLLVPRSEMLAIQKNVVRCRQMVRDLMQFSGEEAAPPEDLDVCEPLRRVLSLLDSRIAFSGVDLEWSRESAGPFQVRGSRSQLQQAFYHLLMNALEAMPQGGKLRIDVRPHPRVPDEAGSKDMVSIHLEDTGVGISPENMEYLFRPFFTARKTGQGPGMGLATARNIVLSHGGQIKVESGGPGRGTRITLLFPCLPPAAKNQSAAQAVLDAPSLVA